MKSFLALSTLAAMQSLASAFVLPFPTKSISSLEMRMSTELLAQPQTKFDTLKSKYKGELNTERSEEDAFLYESFQQSLGQDGEALSQSRGDTITGEVTEFFQDGAFVDIGSKTSAFISLRETGLVPKDKIEEALTIGETREFKVISDSNDMGQFALSIKRLEFEGAWDRIAALEKEDETFNAEVVSSNRGGLLVEVEGLRAFLPGSHLVGGVPGDEYIGRILPVKFLEVNQENNKLVVSNRKAVLETEMNEISRGDVVEGVVKSTRTYGVFVEVRGLSGLLHISQISYDRINDINTVFSPGQKIKVMIVDHDKVNGRIALSTKTLEPEPGDMLKDPQKVYDNAEATAKKYHERMEQERKAREEAAKTIVMGLSEGMNTFDNDILSGIANDLDSVLEENKDAEQS